MYNIKPFSFEKPYTLVQQTPLIHFQHSEEGAAEVHGNPFEKLNQCRDLKVGNMISAKVLEKKNGFCFLSIVQAQPSEEA